jgi:hypothetical protein
MDVRSKVFFFSSHTSISPSPTSPPNLGAVPPTLKQAKNIIFIAYFAISSKEIGIFVPLQITSTLRDCQTQQSRRAKKNKT